jgi:N-methylhydantoinase B
MLSGGGGGYGDPLSRPVHEVSADVFSGYISRKEAEASYGVVFLPPRREDLKWRIDENRTAAKRRSLARANRSKVEAAELIGLDGLINGRRQFFVSRELASRMSLRRGEIVELWGIHPAPLRAWVELLVSRVSCIGKFSKSRIYLDAYSRKVVGVEPGTWVSVRKLINLFPERGKLARRT